MLASLDELVAKKQAHGGICHIIFDNIDFYIRHLHHLTLPILFFERSPTFHLSNENNLSFIDTLNLFDRNLLDLDSEQNEQELTHFKFVVKTVLAVDICKSIESLKWVSNHFERHHKHRYSETASSRSVLHIDPPMPYDEKKTTDMTQILQQLQDRYLNLMVQHIPQEPRDEFVHCKKLVEIGVCEEGELRQAEAFLMETAKHFGFLILHGDLLRDFVQN